MGGGHRQKAGGAQLPPGPGAGPVHPGCILESLRVGGAWEKGERDIAESSSPGPHPSEINVIV